LYPFFNILYKYTESINGWNFSFDTSLTLKLRGTYVENVPNGVIKVVFTESGNTYTWPPVKSIFYGFLYGRLNVNNQGEITITNHKTKEKSVVKYHEAPYYFSKEEFHKVTALIKDKSDLARYLLTGVCVEKVECFSIRNPMRINKFEEVDLLDIGEKRLLWIKNHIE